MIATDETPFGANVTLRESLRQLRQIADSLPVLLAQCDARGCYRFVNRAYAVRFGRAPHELLGQPTDTVVGPVAHAAFAPYVRRALSGEHVTFEVEVPFGGQGRRTLQGEFVPNRSAGGAIESFIGILLDVTDQRRAECALRDREAHFRAAFELSAAGQAMIDLDRRYRLVNDRFCAITGYPRAELIGRRPEELTHPDDIARDVALATALVRGEVQNITSEKRYIRKRGDVCWVRVHATLLKDGDGRPLGAFSMIEDITAQKMAFEQRDRLYAREHAARLAAEAANRTKDEFLATLSHELRTPLNAILGWTQILRRRVLDHTRQGEALAALERSARKQAQLVDDLLDLSRITAGRLALRVERVQLRAVVDLAIETVRPQLEAKRIRLIEPRQADVAVEADPHRLQQAIWNLLSNAVKFTPDGGRIDVDVEPMPDQIRIVVRDTGIGIDPQFLPRLFAPFEQADQSTTRAFEGLGLGLAIVRHVVELHGGTVAADSAGPGHGATFTIGLPALHQATT